MEIHDKGGGIHFTMQHTRRASSEQLYDSLAKRLWAMLRCGTTTVESKSGYGLDTDSEVKMLRAIDRAREDHPIGISSTYCGAHAIPQ